MVALSPRFATLAALCSLAALSAVTPSTNAAAINLRRSVADLPHAARDVAPAIPLPAFSAGAEFGSTPSESQSNTQDSNERRFLGTAHPMLGLSDAWMDTPSRRDTALEPGVIMAGTGNSVAFGDHAWHSASDGGAVIVGDNKQLDIREPHSHDHHHHHSYNESDAVVVVGDNDHVNIHSREPHSHHHDHSNEEDTVIINGNNDHVNIHSRSVLISGGEGASYIVRPSKRFVAQQRFAIPMAKRSITEGVPGTIDIMSPMNDGSFSQRIASLVLASANSTDAMDSSNPSTMSVPSGNNFVLNASPDSKTQIFLVPVPPVATEMAMSTSDDPEIRVTLQMPVFDAASASTQMWCATFDPAPPAPAPLSAASCASGSDDAHKSQVFAYNPSTGAVRPMWYDGQDDGTGTMNDSSSNSSGNTDPETPSDASVASVTDFTVPSRRDDEQVAFASPSASAHASGSMSMMSASSSTASASGTAMVPMSTASSSSDPMSMSTSSIAATDVMLMFTPAEPVVLAASAPEPEYDESPSNMDEMTTSAASSSMSTETAMVSSSSMSASTTSYSSSSSAMPASSSAMPIEAMDYPDTMSMSASSTSSSMSAECTPSVAPCPSDDSSMSASASMTMTSSSSAASPTPSMYGALGVQIIAEAVAPSSESSMSASSTSTTTTTTMSSESASPSMTPVSTAPYTWMFKRDSQ